MTLSCGITFCLNVCITIIIIICNDVYFKTQNKLADPSRSKTGHPAYNSVINLCMVTMVTPTLHTPNRSNTALRPMLATTITSSCLPLLPAATAFVVAWVIGFVYRIRSSAVAFLSDVGFASYACEKKRNFYMLT